MKLAFSLFTIFILSSCQSYNTVNRVGYSTLNFKGGAQAGEEWTETLSFHRTSWYYGTTLRYDVLLAKLPKGSPFLAWFSETGRKKANSCPVFYIALLYKGLTAPGANAIVRNEIKKQGPTEYIDPDFNLNIQGHYAYRQWVLRGHRPVSFCATNEKELFLQLPGFKETKIWPAD